MYINKVLREIVSISIYLLGPTDTTKKVIPQSK